MMYVTIILLTWRRSSRRSRPHRGRNEFLKAHHRDYSNIGAGELIAFCSTLAVLLNHSSEALCRLVPGGTSGGTWREDLRRHILRDGTHLPRFVQFAQAHQLHERVA